MRSRWIWLVGALALLALPEGGKLLAADAIANARWIRAKLGPFEAVSDDGRTAAIQALSQFEQFRYALGVAMGQQDLRLDPPLRIIVFKDAKEMASVFKDAKEMAAQNC